MKLSEYITDIGNPVAYNPKFRKITGSINSALLLCQLLLWTDKTEDGWVWKNSWDIEEETGLNYDEQIGARKLLTERNLIEEQYMRLNHKMRFKINQEELNNLWRKSGGKKITKIKTRKEQREEKYSDKKSISCPEKNKTSEFTEDTQGNEYRKYVNLEEGERDWLIDAVGSENAKKANEKIRRIEEIRNKLQERLNIIADNSRWETFIKFVYQQEINNNRPVDTFITWALYEGFDPLYWTPEKMKTLYPRAFVKTLEKEPSELFVQSLPPVEEKKYTPLPDFMKKKIDLSELDED